MVVGSPTTARATPRTRVRAGWFWSPHWATRSEYFPFRRRISALCAHISDSGRARTLPLGVGAPHRIPRLVAGTRPARSGSYKLAVDTFTPAQPPLTVTSPGEKTNLTLI